MIFAFLLKTVFFSLKVVVAEMGVLAKMLFFLILSCNNRFVSSSSLILGTEFQSHFTVNIGCKTEAV